MITQDSDHDLATVGTVSEKYAARVLAALVNPNGGMSYSRADELIGEYISEIEVEDISRNSEYAVYATITGLDEINNTRGAELFEFQMGEMHKTKLVDDGVVVVFTGFKNTSGTDTTLHLENGLLQSDNATKIRFEVKFSDSPNLNVGETVVVDDENGEERVGELYRTPDEIDESVSIGDHEDEETYHVMLLTEDGQYDHVVSVDKQDIRIK